MDHHRPRGFASVTAAKPKKDIRSAPVSDGLTRRPTESGISLRRGQSIAVRRKRLWHPEVRNNSAKRTQPVEVESDLASHIHGVIPD